MPPTSPKSLEDALAACDLLLAHVAGQTVADDAGDPWLRAGVERSLRSICRRSALASPNSWTSVKGMGEWPGSGFFDHYRMTQPHSDVTERPERCGQVKDHPFL